MKKKPTSKGYIQNDSLYITVFRKDKALEIGTDQSSGRRNEGGTYIEYKYRVMHRGSFGMRWVSVVVVTQIYT